MAAGGAARAGLRRQRGPGEDLGEAAHPPPVPQVHGEVGHAEVVAAAAPGRGGLGVAERVPVEPQVPQHVALAVQRLGQEALHDLGRGLEGGAGPEQRRAVARPRRGRGAVEEGDHQQRLLQERPAQGGLVPLPVQAVDAGVGRVRPRHARVPEQVPQRQVPRGGRVLVAARRARRPRDSLEALAQPERVVVGLQRLQRAVAEPDVVQQRVAWLQRELAVVDEPLQPRPALGQLPAAQGPQLAPDPGHHPPVGPGGANGVGAAVGTGIGPGPVGGAEHAVQPRCERPLPFLKVPLGRGPARGPRLRLPDGRRGPPGGDRRRPGLGAPQAASDARGGGRGGPRGRAEDGRLHAVPAIPLEEQDLAVAARARRGPRHGDRAVARRRDGEPLGLAPEARGAAVQGHRLRAGARVLHAQRCRPLSPHRPAPELQHRRRRERLQPQGGRRRGGGGAARGGRPGGVGPRRGHDHGPAPDARGRGGGGGKGGGRVLLLAAEHHHVQRGGGGGGAVRGPPPAAGRGAPPRARAGRHPPASWARGCEDSSSSLLKFTRFCENNNGSTSPDSGGEWGP